MSQHNYGEATLNFCRKYVKSLYVDFSVKDKMKMRSKIIFYFHFLFSFFIFHFTFLFFIFILSLTTSLTKIVNDLIYTDEPFGFIESKFIYRWIWIDVSSLLNIFDVLRKGCDIWTYLNWYDVLWCWVSFAEVGSASLKWGQLRWSGGQLRWCWMINYMKWFSIFHFTFSFYIFIFIFHFIFYLWPRLSMIWFTQMNPSGSLNPNSSIDEFE